MLVGYISLGTSHKTKQCLINFERPDSEERIGEITRPPLTEQDRINGTNELIIYYFENCTPEEKILLLGATFLLQSKYFSKRTKIKKKSNKRKEKEDAMRAARV